MKFESYQPKSGEVPNSGEIEEVTRDNLPLHCPLERMRLWDSHPRVYLPIEEIGELVQCPYCGTRFVLVE